LEISDNFASKRVSPAFFRGAIAFSDSPFSLAFNLHVYADFDSGNSVVDEIQGGEQKDELIRKRQFKRRIFGTEEAHRKKDGGKTSRSIKYTIYTRN